MSVDMLYALLPTAVLGIGSVLVLLAGAFMRLRSRKELVVLGAAFALLAAAVAALYRPDVAVAGGMVEVGGYGRLASLAASSTALLTLMLSYGYVGRRPLGDEEYPALVLFAAFGMDVLASSVSLVGVFLGLECMSLALYVLLASNRADPRSGEAGLKYLVIGAISTAFFAFGLGLIYTATGTLSLAGSMSGLASAGGLAPLGLAGWAMLLVGFGFKASLFPFHFWAPDVYEGGPAPVVAFLSTGSKAAVFAAFLRLAVLSASGWGSLVPVLWAVAALSMAYGNMAALTQPNIKRLLAYSAVAQMGYVLVALIAAPAVGATAALFYIIAYVAMDMGAFGVVASLSTSVREPGDMDTLRGLGFTHPFRGFVLALCMVSLAGLPPTAGFIGKFAVFYAAVKAGYPVLAVIGIATAIISVYYYLRVVVILYMREPEAVLLTETVTHIVPAQDVPGRFALAMVATALIVLGVLPGSLLDVLAGLL